MIYISINYTRMPQTGNDACAFYKNKACKYKHIQHHLKQYQAWKKVTQ